MWYQMTLFLAISNDICWKRCLNIVYKWDSTAEEKMSYIFVSKWGWVNSERMFICGSTNILNILVNLIMLSATYKSIILCLMHFTVLKSIKPQLISYISLNGSAFVPDGCSSISEVLRPSLYFCCLSRMRFILRKNKDTEWLELRKDIVSVF